MIKTIEIIFGTAIIVVATASCGQNPTSNKGTTAPVEGEMVLTDCGRVARLTGKTLEADKELPNPNKTDERWNLGGTDLGTMCLLDGNSYALFFGDTVGDDYVPVENGGPGNASDWRSNVLAFSHDTDFSDGVTFDSMLEDPSNPKRALYVTDRPDNFMFTSIPTGAVYLNGNIYMHYMYWEVAIRDHDTEGFSSYAVSYDKGKTWVNEKDKLKFSWDSFFGMVAFGQKPGDPYCYMMGGQTNRNFRKSATKLARFMPEDILDKSQYEYWNSEMGKWIKSDESMASELFDGGYGEACLVWFEKYQRWLTIYTSASTKGQPAYRTAKDITGPWSEVKTIQLKDTPGGYGPFILLPGVDSPGDDLYMLLSEWPYYNVFVRKLSVAFE